MIKAALSRINHTKITHKITKYNTFFKVRKCQELHFERPSASSDVVISSIKYFYYEYHNIKCFANFGINKLKYIQKGEQLSFSFRLTEHNPSSIFVIKRQELDHAVLLRFAFRENSDMESDSKSRLM